MTKELTSQIEKLEAKLKEKKRLVAQAEKARRAKEAAAAALLERRKDALIAEMAKATLTTDLLARMDAYLAIQADRELFGLAPRP